MGRPKGSKFTPEQCKRLSKAQISRFDRDGRILPAGLSKPDYHRAYKLLKRFGLTLEDYNRMLEEQGGRCAICGREPNGQQLSVDHDHETNEVRGLLCQPCNLALGHLEAHIVAAFDYLGGDGLSRT
jgi:hypothetical protein